MITENCIIHRNPAGAVPDGSFADINISFDFEADNINNVNLALIYNDGEAKSYTMNKNGDCYNYSLEVSTGLYFYWFEIEQQNGEKEYCYKNDNMQKWQITVYNKDFKTPDAFKGDIMYHIFVDRFAISENFKPEIREGFYMHESVDETPFYKPDPDGKTRNEDVYGGSLMGVIEKLGYLKELNVDIIYLSPIVEANSNHKYNTGDYEKIDGMFGNDEIFDRLIKEAGELGMKVILDGVFNHTGDDSVYFNRYGRYDSIGAYQSKKSPYYNWYSFKDWDNNKDDYDCWWGVYSLPTIKKDEPVFRAFICGINGVIEKWLKRGIAGYRLDVADELSDRMLRDIRKAAKETSPESIIWGEVWEDASNKIAYGQRRQYLLGSQLDSVMNYPLKEAIINYLRTDNSSVMSEVMEMLTVNYPKQSLDCMMNIIGTHDTMRILTALGSDEYINDKDKDKMAETVLSVEERERGIFRLKAAVLMQMTLPGIPCVYYGDEAGMEGYGDPFNRRFFPWDNIDADIYDFYKKICGIRKEYRILFADGEYKLENEKNGLFCYKRIKDGKEICVCVNLSENVYNLSGESLLNGRSATEVKPKSFDITIFV